MYKYTDHARKRMASRGINEDEIKAAIEKGEAEERNIPIPSSLKIVL